MIKTEDVITIVQEVIDKFLIPKFFSEGMNASGQWVESLRIQMPRINEVHITGKHYTKYLTQGRPPSDSLPPIYAIKEWVRVKFGKTGKEVESIAWAVAHKIKQKGTTWYQKGGSDLLEILESPEVVEYVRNRLGELLKISVSEELIRQTKEILT